MGGAYKRIMKKIKKILDFFFKIAYNKDITNGT